MKMLYKIPAFLIIGLLTIMSVSCSDSDDWNPGPQPTSDNQGVYFDKSNSYIYEMAATKDLQLYQDYFVLSLGRDKSKAGSALQVPLIIHSSASNLSIPQTVEFAAGSATAELKIKMSDFEISKPYKYSIEISEKYGNPYKSYENEDGGSTRWDGAVEVLCVLGDATFTPTDYSGSTQPKFIPFKHKIYDNLDGTYTIKNFLFNKGGYNFTFSIDNENNIRPAADCGYHEASGTKDARWYFYSANNDASASRIPCYIPGADPDDYVTYIYFYEAENTTSYQAFWIDTTTKTGRMMGYSRYSKSSSGRIAFNISW